jgi:signal transduction histidine kinase
MIERIRAAGGETVVETARGRGTRVRLRIPIQSQP